MAKTNFEKLIEDKNFLASVLTHDCDNCPASKYCDKTYRKDGIFETNKRCCEIQREWLDLNEEPSKETECRAQILENMDNYLRSVECDEELLESWLMCGLPDGHTESELYDIAEDDAEFRRMVHLFNRLVN
jgi:hypothetical protein